MVSRRNGSFNMKLAKILILIAIPVLIIGFLGCHEKDVSVPDHLIGTWGTVAPRYDGRYVQFTKDHIIFHVGAEHISTHLIKKLKGTRRGKYITYKLVYRGSEGNNVNFRFTYDPSNEGEIRLKNQRNVTWVKSASTEESKGREARALMSGVQVTTG